MNGYRNASLLALAATLAAGLPSALAAVPDPTLRALLLLAGVLGAYAIGVGTDRRGPWLPAKSLPPKAPDPPESPEKRA